MPDETDMVNGLILIRLREVFFKRGDNMIKNFISISLITRLIWITPPLVDTGVAACIFQFFLTRLSSGVGESVWCREIDRLS